MHSNSCDSNDSEGGTQASALDTEIGEKSSVVGRHAHATDARGITYTKPTGGSSSIGVDAIVTLNPTSYSGGGGGNSDAGWIAVNGNPNHTGGCDGGGGGGNGGGGVNVIASPNNRADIGGGDRGGVDGIVDSGNLNPAAGSGGGGVVRDVNVIANLNPTDGSGVGCIVGMDGTPVSGVVDDCNQSSREADPMGVPIGSSGGSRPSGGGGDEGGGVSERAVDGAIGNSNHSYTRGDAIGIVVAFAVQPEIVEVVGVLASVGSRLMG